MKMLSELRLVWRLHHEALGRLALRVYGRMRGGWIGRVLQWLGR